MKLDLCNGVDFVNIILYYRFVSFLNKTLYFTTFHENTISVVLVSRVLLLVLLIVLLIQSFTSTFQVKNVYAPTFLVYCTSYFHFTNFIPSCSHTRFVLYNHSFLYQLTVDSAKQKHYSNIDSLFFAFFKFSFISLTLCPSGRLVSFRSTFFSSLYPCCSPTRGFPQTKNSPFW